MFADNNLRQWNDVLVIQIQQQVYLTQAAHRKSFHQHQQRPHYLTFFCNSLRRAQAELWMSRQICGKLHQWLRQHQSASPASVSVTLHYITLHGMYSQWPRHALMFERTQLTDSSHTHTAFVHFALSKTWIQLTTQHSWHSWLTALYCSDSVTTYCEKLNVFPRSVSVTTYCEKLNVFPRSVSATTVKSSTCFHEVSVSLLWRAQHFHEIYFTLWSSQ